MPLTIDRFLELQHITADNIDEYIRRNGQSYFGMGWDDVSFGCTPKGVQLGFSFEPDYSFWTWKEIKDYLTKPKQITFEGWN